jgi:4-alpha-glucanotransferase
MRWEREWEVEGEPYIDPSEYPEISVATTGTHDTEPLAAWWDSLSDHDRRDVEQMPTVQHYLRAGFEPIDAMLRALLDSRSRLTIIPLQDLFGWSDRINTPAQVSDANWSWRLPWPVDRLRDLPDARSRADTLATWIRDAGRLPRHR